MVDFDKLLKLNNKLSQVRILMLEIRHRIDSPVIINDNEVKSLYLNLITEKYDTIELIHGKEFMDTLIKIYEEMELYENCAEMLVQSNQLAKLRKC